jgi:predicted AAA+ superfamily ATPase
MLNYAKISKGAGVSVPTVKNYYQLLEDMFLGFRVTAFSGSPRKNLLSTERLYFFDVGVRHAAAELPLQPATVKANPGPIFGQWVGVGLWKRLKYLGAGKLHYLRTKAGAEADFIIERAGRFTPVEVKWTENPSLSDARHLLTFLDEHPKRAKHGYIICRCQAPLRLHDNITALPWFCL